MGLKISPAFAQSKMEQCLHNIEELDIYIDDVGIFTGGAREVGHQCGR